MKIALIGYGKMGRLIHKLSHERGHSVVAIIDSKTPLHLKASQESIEKADICIDFSTPKSVIDNVKTLSLLNKNIIMGTTGWTENFNTVKDIVESSNIGFLHSPNFSFGVAHFLKIIENTAKLMSPNTQYEVAGIEMHHRHKLDRPSGTAKAIETEINKHFSHQPLAFTSVRSGNIPGTHTVIFDSLVDTITLTHTARNREGFAEGAIISAEWLIGKKGMYTLDDILNLECK